MLLVEPSGDAWLPFLGEWLLNGDSSILLIFSCLPGGTTRPSAYIFWPVITVLFSVTELFPMFSHSYFHSSFHLSHKLIVLLLFFEDQSKLLPSALTLSLPDQLRPIKK